MKDKELILLLDDCRWNREMLRGFLVHQGYRVMVASTGHEAVEVVKHHSPDLMMMDLSGFRPDRFKALQWVKGHQEYRDTPVVVISEHQMEGEREACLTEGADVYLSKPVSLSSFRRRLKGWFTKGRSSGSLCAKLLGA